MFYGEYCEIFKNTIFNGTPPVAAFEILKLAMVSAIL